MNLVLVFEDDSNPMLDLEHGSEITYNENIVYSEKWVFLALTGCNLKKGV